MASNALTGFLQGVFALYAWKAEAATTPEGDPVSRAAVAFLPSSTFRGREASRSIKPGLFTPEDVSRLTKKCRAKCATFSVQS
jgi:hypothetical protein